MKALRFTSLLTIFLCGITTITAGDNDWPTFRGQNSNGIIENSKLPESFPEGGPKEMWRVPIGHSYAEPLVIGDRIYTCTSDPQPAEGSEVDKEQEYLACFSAKDGKELWRTPIDKLRVTEFGNGPRATPTYNDGMIYAVSANGTLVAVNTDGKLQWSKNYSDFGSRAPQWGYSSAPIVFGDMLIAQPGGTEGRAVMTFNKKTGESLWNAMEGRSGYLTPSLMEIHGTKQIISAVSEKAFALDLKGKTLWEAEFHRAAPISMPTFLPPDKLLFSSNDASIAKMYRISKDGDAFTAEQLWETNRFKNHFSASVTVDGKIIGFDAATLKCINPEDGSMIWGKRGFGKGSLIRVGTNLLIMTDRGTLVMAKANTEAYEELGQFQPLKGRCWVAPVVVGKRLYLRNNEEMVCYSFGS